MRIDGPHRVLVVCAGLWAAYGLLILGEYERGRMLYHALPIPWGPNWPPHTGAHPWLEMLAFLVLPIAFLYGVGWAGRKVVVWVAAGFDQRANSGLVDPGRHQ